jgi:Fe(3+) dicitrate transport protein
VQLPGFATAPDLPDPATGAYGARQVDVDRFGSTTTELRVVHGYTLLGRPQTLAAGASLSANRMRRQGVGRGTAGTGYDLTLTGDFARDVTFTSRAVAAYAEQAVQVTPRWAVVPGVRVERGATRMAGRLAYYDPADVPRRVRHDFPLFGVRTTYRAGRDARGPEWYGGWAQAYRPQILKDLLPESAIERTDPDIRDARGWTLEGGLRGTWRGLSYDAGAYEVRVDNRFGTLVRADAATGEPYVYKTNVGATRTRGLELRVDAPLATLAGPGGGVAVRGFTAAALTDAAYRGGTVVDGGAGGANRALRGNRVEGVPASIVRSGLTAAGARWSATLLASRTAASYSDPLNTVAPAANGARGRVPAYTLVDLDGGVSVAPWLRVGAGVSNALDARYFTKRPTFYPGPGVWPSDGRTVRVSVELTP